MSDEHAGQHHVNYASIFGILCVFTALSVLFDIADMKEKTVLGVFNGTILLAFLVLSVAVAKALCVMAFFMHLKFEGNWKFVLLAPTCALAMGLPLALLPDIGVHYYTQDVPQMYDKVTVHDAVAAHAEETGEKPKTPKKSH